MGGIWNRNFKNRDDFLITGLGSTISALQVSMVENIKFNDDLAPFFKDFCAKTYTVH